MATYGLLPGAWSGGWQWRTVARLLQADRHEVFTPTLTGLGERVHLASPSVDLATHVEDVVNVLIYEELHDVVLVGFSYSGLVAFVPQDGQSLMDMIGPEAAAHFEDIAAERGDGWRIPHDPPDAPRRTAQPLRTFQDPVAVRNPDALTLPRTYIFCTNKAGTGDGGAGITASAVRARDAGWRYHELPTTHVAMETMPRELADLLLDLV